MPYLLAGFRMAVGMGLVMAVVAEFFSGNQGIGYMIAMEGAFYYARIGWSPRDHGLSSAGWKTGGGT